MFLPSHQPIETEQFFSALVGHYKKNFKCQIEEKSKLKKRLTVTWKETTI